MSDNSKHIQDWQDKVKHTFDDESNLLNYLIHTLDNFIYRYLETSESKNLKSQGFDEKTYGAISYESNMVEVLKNSSPLIKQQLIHFAKSLPKSMGPKVQYSLSIKLTNLKTSNGEIQIISKISWDFPEFKNDEKSFIKTVSFKYSDLSQFRKELALKLEEACEIFL